MKARDGKLANLVSIIFFSENGIICLHRRETRMRSEVFCRGFSHQGAIFLSYKGHPIDLDLSMKFPIDNIIDLHIGITFQLHQQRKHHHPAEKVTIIVY